MTYRCTYCNRVQSRDQMVQRGSKALQVCLSCAEAGRNSTVRQARADRRAAFGHAFVEAAPDPAPVRLVGDLLAESRAAGREFDSAWSQAVDVALETVKDRPKREQWHEALEATRDAWLAAYDRRTGSGDGCTARLSTRSTVDSGSTSRCSPRRA